MSSHGHGGRPAGPSAAEPTFAEQARTLVHLARAGTLGTLSRRHPGHPFVSVMPYVPDERGRPLVLISGLAMHTQNLDADPRTSLLVVQAGHEDPLAMARVTLMGRAHRLPEAERPAAREAYLARHPNAVHWVDYEDFAFWRIDLDDVYFVGSFGAMDWLTVDGYGAARPALSVQQDDRRSVHNHVSTGQAGCGNDGCRTQWLKSHVCSLGGARGGEQIDLK